MSIESNSDGRIYRGEDKDVYVWLNSKGEDERDRPFDLSSASEIIAIFANDDDTALVKKLSNSEIAMINAGGGNFKVILKAAETRKLKIGDNQAVEVRAIINQHMSIAQIPAAITVLESLFPEVI